MIPAGRLERCTIPGPRRDGEKERPEHTQTKAGKWPYKAACRKPQATGYFLLHIPAIRIILRLAVWSRLK